RGFCLLLSTDDIDHNVVDVVAGTQQANATDEKLLFSPFEVAATGVCIPPPQSGKYLLQRDPKGGHPLRLQIHLILLDKATKTHDISHPRCHLEVPGHGPILEPSQLGGVGLLSLQTISINFPDGS